jgi:DNA-binding ferritin-like protein
MESSVFISVLQRAIILTNFLQLAHWGTRGALAYSYHELFGKIHGEMASSIDVLGELASIKGVAVNSEIFDQPTPKITSSDPGALLNGILNLLDDYKIALQNLCRAAEQNYERGVVNAVDDRFTQVDIFQYLLEASLPAEAPSEVSSEESSDHTEVEPQEVNPPEVELPMSTKTKKKARKKPE